MKQYGIIIHELELVETHVKTIKANNEREALAKAKANIGSMAYSIVESVREEAAHDK